MASLRKFLLRFINLIKFVNIISFTKNDYVGYINQNELALNDRQF